MVTKMQEFTTLVTNQLKTMDKLLFLQSEVERCQEVEKKLVELQEVAKAHSIRLEISNMKSELREIQKEFEKQTNDIIRSYQQEKMPV